MRCALFGGRVVERPDGVEVYELSGDPAQAREDLVALGAAVGLVAPRSASGPYVFAKAWSSFQAIEAWPSTSGRKSQNVIP